MLLEIFHRIAIIPRMAILPNEKTNLIDEEITEMQSKKAISTVENMESMRFYFVIFLTQLF